MKLHYTSRRIAGKVGTGEGCVRADAEVQAGEPENPARNPLAVGEALLSARLTQT